MRASDQVQSAEDSSSHTSDTVPGKQQASERVLLQQYKLIKQQIAARRYTDALEQGWQLLNKINTAVEGNSSSSRCLQELLVAASLNVAICTAEGGTPDTLILQHLNQALYSLVPILRFVSMLAKAMHPLSVQEDCLHSVCSWFTPPNFAMQEPFQPISCTACRRAVQVPAKGECCSHTTAEGSSPDAQGSQASADQSAMLM